MARKYGMEMAEKKVGHWLCLKCTTWVVDRSKECPWCGTEKPKVVEESKKTPTKTDTDLFQYMKTASEEEKAKILRYIEDEL